MRDTPPKLPNDRGNNKIKNCPDCGGIVSKKAKKCPHCGAKLPKEVGVFGVIIALFVGLFIYQCTKISNETTSSVSSVQATSSGQTLEEMMEQNKTWSITASKDDMRNTSTHFATQESITRKDLGYPYNNQYLYVTLRSSSKADDVILSLKSGQFWCPTQCKVLIRFKDEPIKTYEFVGPEGGSTDALFMVSGRTGFAKKLKEGKSYMIEAPIFDRGDIQWSFMGGDLDWDHF